MSGNNAEGLSATQLPGISAATSPTPTTSWQSSPDRSARIPRPLTSPADFGVRNGATNQRDYVLDYYAGYLQDTWKVLPRFTLSGGLRYDSTHQ